MKISIVCIVVENCLDESTENKFIVCPYDEQETHIEYIKAQLGDYEIIRRHYNIMLTENDIYTTTAKDFNYISNQLKNIL